jgi:hypothetical protein
MITKYVENEDGSIQQINEHDGARTSHYPLFKGQTKTRQVDHPTELEPVPLLDAKGKQVLGDNGEKLYEYKPKIITETYEPYAELLDSGVEIEWLTDDAKDKAAKVVETQAFRTGRKTGISNASVTTTTGKVFSADETSITRMNESLYAITLAVESGMIADVSEFPLQWVLHDAESGEGVEITYAELVEAFVLANQNRASLWLKK